MIKKVEGMEILDSRGNPTIQCTVTLNDGTKAAASVPSGASTGAFEAVELRDGDNRYCGKGVQRAVDNINNVIAFSLKDKNPLNQMEIDKLLCEIDGTENKSKLGANAILAVSLAVAKVSAKYLDLPLYKYLGGFFTHKLPVPMMNILNGGAHASNNIDIQEFMIMPTGANSYKEGLRQCCEIYHKLGTILKSEGLSVGIGDEGGFAPDLKNDETAIDFIIKAIKEAGYTTENTKIALDVASSEWYKNGEYYLPKRNKMFSTKELIDWMEYLVNKYPIVSIEDGLSEHDWDGWQALTIRLGDKVQLVGDDLFVTNPKRLEQGIYLGVANSILIKINQIGTLTETLKAIDIAHKSGYTTVISHRSGETDDTTIADIALAVNSGQIKTGAPCRMDRVSKYNRLLNIEKELGNCGKYVNPFITKQ